MGADVPPPGSKGTGDRAFSRYGVATVVMQILLVIGGFDVELTLVDTNNEEEHSILLKSFTYYIFFISSLRLNNTHLQT